MDQHCCICGQPLDDYNVGHCISCGGRFHVAWSVGADVPECGGYWINENSCALTFACANCLALRPAPQQQSDNRC